VIKTAKGYHLVTILERKPGEIRSLSAMSDKIRQLIIDEKQTAFLQSLQDKYDVVWKIMKTASGAGN
jgi:peptidyl-prolyl cis-trans isomerase C